MLYINRGGVVLYKGNMVVTYADTQEVKYLDFIQFMRKYLHIDHGGGGYPIFHQEGESEVWEHLL